MNSWLCLAALLFLFCNAEGNVYTNANASYSGLLIEKDKPLELQCNLTGDSTDAIAISWKKDGAALEDNQGFVQHDSNFTLRVDNPKEGVHTGTYVCYLTRPGDAGPYNASIFVQARAHVTPFSRSINLVQGDTVTLKCIFGGVPRPTIRWYKDDVTVNETDTRVNISYGQEGTPTKMFSQLKIEDLDYPDKGTYKCEAENDLGEPVSTSITVRVKDKLAALWPFLGICVEVAILCTIIFVYEKKRVKPDFEESDADHNTDNKNVLDQKEGAQDVRHRK